MTRFPDQAIGPASAPPIVYVTEKTVWEYKQVVRNLSQNDIPTESELNEWGKDGWELVTVLNKGGLLYLYFKRVKN